MSISKQNAIVCLVRLIAEIDDGNWTREKMEHAILYGGFAKYIAYEDWVEKMETGELNEDSSINLLNKLKKQDRIDCLLACFATAVADSDLSLKEEDYLNNLFNKFQDISMTEIANLYRKNLGLI
jgi:hypothetical protein